VSMRVSGGKGLSPQEDLEMMRAALKGAPKSEFEAYVDLEGDHAEVLDLGSRVARAVKLLVMTNHKPLCERQRRAKAEYESNNMRTDPGVSYQTFQAGFQRTRLNLKRVEFEKSEEEFKTDFFEKLPEECSRYLRLARFQDPVSGEIRGIKDVEDAQVMASTYFNGRDAMYRALASSGLCHDMGKAMAKEYLGEESSDDHDYDDTEEYKIAGGNSKRDDDKKDGGEEDRQRGEGPQEGETMGCRSCRGVGHFSGVQAMWRLWSWGRGPRWCQHEGCANA
jgi:hypothetical protein